MNSISTSLNARCVSRCRLTRASVSCGLSYAASTSPSSSRCLAVSLAATVYASLRRSSARISSLVSCLYDSGGKGIGANLRASSQCTAVVYTATASSGET